MKNNLIYILNSYKESESSHFYHVFHLLDELARQNISVTLLIEKAYSLPIFENPNINVITLKKKGVFRLLELFGYISKRTKTQKNSIFIRITSISAIISSLAVIKKDSKVFFWQSGTTYEWDWAQPISFKKIIWFFKSFVPSYLARRLVNRFVTGPEYMADYYHNIVRVDKNKIRILYNDIDLNRFDIDKNKRKIYKDDFFKLNPQFKDKKIILLVHKMSPVRKTSMYIPNALECVLNNHDDICFLIVGGGSELPEIKSVVESKGLQNIIHFYGEIPNKEIQKLYCVADVFIHPTYNEGFPRVMLEAMASGLPFVSTDAGGVYDITPYELHEFITPRDSVELFSNKLLNLLNNRDKWQEYGIISKNHVKKYDTPIVAKMYINVLFENE